METEKQDSEEFSTSYHSLSVEEALEVLQVSGETGLTKKEVEQRAIKYGFNELKKEKGITALSILLDQFKNPL